MPDPGVHHPSLVDRLVAHIIGRIASGAWAGGRRFTEAELAADFGVSRTPVREAVRRMAETGLLILHARKRAALEVVSVTRDDLNHITRLRASLECLALRLAMDRMTPAQLERLGEWASQCEALLKDRKVDRLALFAADGRFHLAIAALSGNRYLEEALQRLDGKVQVCRMRLCRSEHSIRGSVRFHRRILTAMTAGDAALAEELLQQHIASMLEEE